MWWRRLSMVRDVQTYMIPKWDVEMLEGLMVQIFAFILFRVPEMLSFAHQVFISNLSVFAHACI